MTVLGEFELLQCTLTVANWKPVVTRPCVLATCPRAIGISNTTTTTSRPGRLPHNYLWTIWQKKHTC